MALNSDDRNALGTSHVGRELSSNANYSNEVFGALIYEGASILDTSTTLEVEKGMLNIVELRKQRAPNPPSLQLILEVGQSFLHLMDSMILGITYDRDAEWGHATIQMGSTVFVYPPFHISDIWRVHDFVQAGPFVVKFSDQKFIDWDQICGYIAFFPKVEPSIVDEQILPASWYDRIDPCCMLFFALGVQQC